MPIPLEETAARQGISKKYLEIVVKMLVGGKLVKGTSGKGGGYCLLRSPEAYTVGEIEGTLSPVACLEEGTEACPRESACKTLPMWKKFDTMVREYFFHITIADLVNGDL